MKKGRTLRDLFSFPGFLARQELEGRFGDPKSRIIMLNRKKKRRIVPSVELSAKVFTIGKIVWLVTVMSKDIGYIYVMKDGGYIAGNVMVCTWKH